MWNIRTQNSSRPLTTSWACVIAQNTSALPLLYTAAKRLNCCQKWLSIPRRILSKKRAVKKWTRRSLSCCIISEHPERQQWNITYRDMFRCTKIDSSYHRPKMWLSAHDKSLLYCLLFGRPLPSYLPFYFPLLYLLVLWFYHFHSVFRFLPSWGWGQVCFLSFCSLSFQYGSSELLHLPLHFIQWY